MSEHLRALSAGRAGVLRDIVARAQAALRRRVPDPPVAEADRWSRPARTLAVAGAALSLAIIALAALSIWQLHDAEMLRAKQTLRQLDVALAEQANRSFASVSIVLGEVVKDLAADAIDQPEADRGRGSDPRTRAMLQQRVHGLPQLAEIALIDAAGRLVNSSRAAPMPIVDVSDRDYFLALRDDPNRQVLIGRLGADGSGGASTIYLARRITAAGGSFRGLVLGTIDTRRLTDFYRHVVRENNSVISLLRSDGTLLLEFPERSRPIGGFLAETPAYQDIVAHAAEGAFRLRDSVDGINRIAVASALRDYPAAVIVSQDRSVALEDWRTESRVITATGGAAALAILLLAAVLIRQIGAYELVAQARAEARQAAQAQAQAEALSEGKSHFVASISHELRTPLNAVIGFSELLKAQTFGPMGSDRYVGYASDIHHSGTHLLSIVNDILDYTKAEAKQLTLTEEPVDIRGLIASAAQMLHREVERADLHLQIDVPDELPTVLGDRKRLLQSLVNLLANAVKFTPEGGTVTVAVAMAGDHIVIRVRDTGIGIAAEDLDQVMLPFRQVDSRLARKNNGTGLGLPLTKHFIELHGGTLALASTPGIGTEVTIILPTGRESADPPDGRPAQRPEGDRAD